jgi:hypothetical protein
MPLNKKGKKIKKAMVKQYGKKKGESVFYAMENSGKLKKVIKARGGAAAQAAEARGNMEGRASPSGGVDRSAVGAGSEYAKNRARAAIDAQRKKTIQQLTPPSQTLGGRALYAGLTLAGVPFAGTVTKKLIDKPYWQRGKKPIKETQVVKDTKPFTPFGAGEGEGDVKTPIIAGPVKVNEPVLSLDERRLGTVSPTGSFGYTVGLRKGGMLRQGKPKLAKKGWK